MDTTFSKMVPSFPHIRKLWAYNKKKHFKENSVIVITGASSGIGKELTLQYATRKCRLVLASRNKIALEKIAESCREFGSQALVVPTDVRNREECKNLIDQTIETFKKIDILVLNAGVGCHNVFYNTKDISLYEEILKVNFFGYLHTCFYAFPYLMKNNGQILVVSTLAGEIGLPYRTAYCASKFAITGFFESLRAEIEMNKPLDSSTPVYITIACPPAVDTNLRRNSLTTDPHLRNIHNPIRSLTPQQAATIIIDAADRRLRKVYFPLTSFLGVYFRPFFPDIVDYFAMQRAHL